MAEFLLEKLAKLPIGTHLELTYEDYSSHFKQVRGVLTDSDFCSGVEISPENGPQLTLDSTIVRACQPTKLLSAVIRELPLQTKLLFSYGEPVSLRPTVQGTLILRQEDTLTIRTESGDTVTVPVEQIHSLLPADLCTPDTLFPAERQMHREDADQKNPDSDRTDKKEKPDPDGSEKEKEQEDENQKTRLVIPEIPFYDQKPENFLRYSDGTLKKLFASLPGNERKLLSGCHDSFFHGVKVNDMVKMHEAAARAVRIFDGEYNDGYDWTDGAIEFCTAILARTNEFDRGLYLMRWDFAGAAYAAYREEEFTLSGAFALLAMKTCEPDQQKNLLILLAKASVRTADYSALQIYCDDWEILPGSDGDHMVRDVLKKQEIQPGVQETLSDAVFRLRNSGSDSRAMENEIRQWNDRYEEAMKEQTQQENDEVAAGDEESGAGLHYGIIDKLFWTSHTGMIDDENGTRVEFSYSDVQDGKLGKFLNGCLSTDMDGQCQAVQFEVENDKAVRIVRDNTLVDRGRAMAAGKPRENGYAKALVMCDRAVKACMTEEVLPDYVYYAALCSEDGGDLSWARKAIDLYQKNRDFKYDAAATNAYMQMNLARCCICLKDCTKAVEYARNGLKITGNVPRIRLNALAQALEVLQTAYQQTHKRDLLKYIRTAVREFRSDCREELEEDSSLLRTFEAETDPYVVFAECSRDHLEEAEAPFARMDAGHPSWNMLHEMIAELRRRQAQKHPSEPQTPIPEEKETAGNPVAPETGPSEAERRLPAAEPELCENTQEPSEAPEEIPAVYQDREGWRALNLDPQDVIDYALSMDGPDRLPAMLAYLHSGARLNPDIKPVYQAAALGANDPAQTWQYTMDELVTACPDVDGPYREFTDWCRAAAFLRFAYFAPEGFQYGIRQMCASLEISKRMPEFEKACDLLIEFVEQAGVGADRYAMHHHSCENSAQKRLSDAGSYVKELYQKYILSGPREGAQCTRLFETKRIALAPDGYLGTLLRDIVEGNTSAMMDRKQDFADRFLLGSGSFADGRISTIAVDEMVDRCWEDAGRFIATKKVNDVVQGNGRRNLHSTFSEILSAVCQWYAATELGGDLSWLTAAGEEAWQTAEPDLQEKLESVDKICEQLQAGTGEPQKKMGAFLLGAAAREMQARLDGKWRARQNRFFYVDFLRSDEILLKEDFLPDLDATFCTLPDFNILARIRRHVESPKRSFREQFARIYGKDRTGNNYGTAERIVRYLRETGDTDAVMLPENAQCYVEQSHHQAAQSYRVFREEYALAKSRGQVLPEDHFSRTLEETVRWWYEWAEETGNYGFFRDLLPRCLDRLREKALKYGGQLARRLELLMADRPGDFDKHPVWAAAVREQIDGQNYAAAEDWMRRIGCGDFSLEHRKPWAITCLEQFWDLVPEICEQVCNAGRSLAFLLKQNKGSQIAVRQLIAHWVGMGAPTSAGRLEQLLKLLGWNPTSVIRVPAKQSPDVELYEAVMAEENRISAHAVAAFGSQLQQMYVACLSGGYDIDSLYRSLSGLDELPGCKLILLDCALSQPDRRMLARLVKLRDGGLKHPCILIDRVLISYLNDHYDENTVSRMVMALGMPFAYCRPFTQEFAPETFYGREKELQEIRRCRGICLITGLDGMGKTAILRKAAYDLSSGDRCHVIFVQSRDRNMQQLTDMLKEQLCELELLSNMEEEQAPRNLSSLAEAALRHLNEEESLWFLLDDADAVLHWTDDLNALEQLIHSNPDRLHVTLTAREEAGCALHAVRLLPLDSTAAENLLTVPLSYLGFHIPDPAIVSQILAACDYRPKLIREFAGALLEAVRNEDYALYNVRNAPPYTVTDTHLRRVLTNPEIRKMISGKYRDVLQKESKHAGSYLSLAYLIGWMYSIHSSETGYTAEEILSQADELDQAELMKLSVEQMTVMLEKLKDLNILCCDVSGCYRLASRSFRDLMGSDDEIMENLMKEGGEEDE